MPSSAVNDGQRLLGEDLYAHAALEQYRQLRVGTVTPRGRSVVVVVVVVLTHARTYTEGAGPLLDLGETLEAHNYPPVRVLRGQPKGELSLESRRSPLESSKAPVHRRLRDARSPYPEC